MEKTRELPEKSEEMVTISRAEYEALQAKLSAKEEELTAALLKNQWLLEQLRLNRKKQYGPSSEQLDQLVFEQFGRVFNEAEAWCAGVGKKETQVKAHTRKPRSGSLDEVAPEGTPVEVDEDPNRRLVATIKPRAPKQSDKGSLTYSSANDVPFRGTPGSTAKSPDGTKERVFGPNGLPSRDRHYTDHGNPKQHPYVPHDPDWGYNEDGKWAPGTGYPSPSGPLTPVENFSIQWDTSQTGEIISFGVGAIFAYELIKWAIALLSSPITGGASVVGAVIVP